MKIALIGAGYIAGVNGRALLNIGQSICAVSNRTAQNAEQLCEKLGIRVPVYLDHIEMLENERPDAVLINTAHHLHLQCFLDCAKRGLDIIIEKPLGNTYAQCNEMIRAARSRGIKASVCHTQRYNAVYMAASEFIQNHDPGKLLSVSDHIHCHYFWDGRSPWQLSKEESGGGIALNYGVHQLDRVHFFLKERSQKLSAVCLAQKPDIEVYSSYSMLGVTTGGIPYSITCTGYSGPFINETRLVFERGILQCCLTGNGVHPYGLFYGSNETGAFQEVPVTLSNDRMYERQFQAVIDYFESKREEPPIPLEWAAEMVRLVEHGRKNQL